MWYHMPHRVMSNETAFLGASTVFGKYWTSHSNTFFDYLIDKDNFKLTFGKSFRMMVYLDSAIANGPVATRNNVEGDTRATKYLINHLADIKPEFTVFVTTCDMLEPTANENTPTIKQSDDPYVQNRIDMYEAVNRQYGRVLNVHLTEIASQVMPEFSELLSTIKNPPKGTKKLPFAPNEYHQFYHADRLMKDVERCIPLGIPSIIPAAPPLTTTEVVQALAPNLVKRLREPQEGDPYGSNRTSIHSFQWLDPKDGYQVSKSDQLALLDFFFGPNAFM